mgnify:CR=1 FL=1
MRKLMAEEKRTEEKLHSPKVTDCNKLTEPLKEQLSPEQLYQRLIATIREYHPSDDISQIEKAYQVAKEAHKEQKRKSGEPYIVHPPVSLHLPVFSNCVPRELLLGFFLLNIRFALFYLKCPISLRLVLPI